MAVVVVVLGRGRWGGDGRGVSIGGRGGVWEDGDGEEKQEESCALRAVASRDDRSDAGGRRGAFREPSALLCLPHPLD